jgi:hypothetical protein
MNSIECSAQETERYAPKRKMKIKIGAADLVARPT